MRELTGPAVRIVTPAEAGHPDVAPATPVLLLHGFASDGETDWIATGTAAELAAAGHTVLVADLPGHGASPAPGSPEQATAPAQAAALLAALDAVGVDGFDLVGYSLGARLAWEIPALADGRVGRVVLGGLSPMDPFAAVDTAALHRAVADGSEPGDQLTAMIARLVRSHGERAAGLATCVEGLGRTPFDPGSWAASAAPLFVVGAEDPLTGGIDGIVATLDGAQLVTVPGDHLGALTGTAFRHTVRKALER
ncbi:alpha/beta fold hydrolase [Kitasatospora sp. NPDC101183]|uniref:alpha/beta fold hydrolase n=1 Tax=Kitasatospora sp. NPDC101183 TaxID=3364100 RepID=UPI0038221961